MYHTKEGCKSLVQPLYSACMTSKIQFLTCLYKQRLRLWVCACNKLTKNCYASTDIVVLD